MMSEWKLVDVEGIGSGYACLTLDGVSTTKSRNLIQADRGAGGDGLGLPEQFRPLVEKARELLPVPEVQQPEREQERGHTWGGMEL